MKKEAGKVVYAPTDLIRYLASPFSSWMDRYHLEFPETLTPDEDTEEEKLIARTGDKHERRVLEEFKKAVKGLIEIGKADSAKAKDQTISAIANRAPIVFQAALGNERFFGFSDFVILGDDGTYQIWDTKLARSPKPYYAIQLCCYSEMFVATTGMPMPKKFGIILGTNERIEFLVEDYFHYYAHIRDEFLAMQDGFAGDMRNCPEPLPGANHGRWTSYAEKFFAETDHLVLVAGITVGQIKKLKAAGITTAAALAKCEGVEIPRLSGDTLSKLAAQARLQKETQATQEKTPDAPPAFEVLPNTNPYEPVGLASLPVAHPADVFFDMEGYPLAPGGLEYLFGASAIDPKTGNLSYFDWWAQDRDEEKIAFEGFVDWAFARWRANPGMHIYHYAAYEVSAVRRLSTRHDTRQDEVDQLLRHEVFVDLYSVVRHGLRIGEDSYSIKKVERLYRPARVTEVATATESIVRYAQWIETEASPKWQESEILKDIRDYNEDDCKSTYELLQWMQKTASDNKIAPSKGPRATKSAQKYEEKELSPEVVERLAVIEKLRKQGDPLALTIADLVDFHRREEKPMWWRMFDRASATPEELRDDSGCIEGVRASGGLLQDKQSLVQGYRFDPAQECKLAADKKVMFAHSLDAKLTLTELDLQTGELQLKLGKRSIDEKFGGSFPRQGSLIPDEYVSAKTIQLALAEVARAHLSNALPAHIRAMLERRAPAAELQIEGETTIDAAIRTAMAMKDDCLVVQGPPGTGKTYSAARVINALVAAGKTVGVTSNSHKAVINLLEACGAMERDAGRTFRGVKVGGDGKGALFADNPGVTFVEDTADGIGTYRGGVVGGTAWLFVRPEWESKLDFLFVDEAGQVSLANTVAVARAAKNLVLLGDQMQLEQPIQGTHPGDAGLSGLQFVLKDTDKSKIDEPVFHAVIPSSYGLFLGESRRMHPSICSFISESIYEGRLTAHADCTTQRVALPEDGGSIVKAESGIVFSAVEHDGNIQQSDEEVERVRAIFEDLVGRSFTAADGAVKQLDLSDFLFIAPYNAQVRALQAALPKDAKVGSVDKFQGQQAPVCILSLCSSYGEYGGRGLSFILDRNRINVAMSRAKCLAVVVADPRIATTSVGSLAEMKLINLFCKLSYYR